MKMYSTEFLEALTCAPIVLSIISDGQAVTTASLPFRVDAIDDNVAICQSQSVRPSTTNIATEVPNLVTPTSGIFMEVLHT